MQFLYDDTATSHPVVEYHPDRNTDTESALLLQSDIPSFVLDVTWPRIVQYYHPSSPQCQQFADTYVRAARDLRHDILRGFVEFHAVNCAVHVALCENEGVVEVPTLVWYDAGSIESQVLKRVERKKGGGLDLDYVANELGLILKKKNGKKQKTQQKQRGEGMDGDLDNAAVESSFEAEEKKLRAKKANEESRGEGSYGNVKEKTAHYSTDNIESQIYADAMASLVTSISSSIYPPNDPTSSSTTTTLSPERANAFHSLLDLFHWTLPPSWTLAHDLINDLRNDFDIIIQNADSLNVVVQRHHLLSTNLWSSRCTSTTYEEDERGKKKMVKSSGYSCGLWTLFHVVTIGVAERHGDVLGVVAAEQRRQERKRKRLQWRYWWGASNNNGEENDNEEEESEQRVSTLHGAKVIRDYVDLFFGGCKTCRENFVAMYDSCGFRVCERMTANGAYEGMVDHYDDGDWKELALWLWEVHNDVNVRKDSTSAAAVVFGNKDEVLWPSQEECAQCRYGRGANGELGWDMDEVYDHLKQVYWPKGAGKGVENPHMVVLGNWARQKVGGRIRAGVLRGGTGYGGVGLFSMCIFLLLFASFVYVGIWSRQSHRYFSWAPYFLRGRGRHKKKKRRKDGLHDDQKSSQSSISRIGNGVVKQRARRISGGSSVSSMSHSTGRRRWRHTFVDG